MAQAPSNPQLIPGISRLSRTNAYKRKSLYKTKKAAAPAKPEAAATHKVKEIGGKSNNKTRNVALKKVAALYSTEDAPVAKKSRKTHSIAPLRASITPGTVLILLAGRFRGKRVVFLKQLESGLLLVTGPHKANGVPLRRVNQAYVIATSTKLDVSGVSLDAKFNDAYFKKSADKKAGTTDSELFDKSQKKPTDEGRLADQKSIDKSLIAILKKDRVMKAYLNASFSLSKGQFPHLLKF